MCSYCGCEAEKVMKALTDEHVEIAELARKVIGELGRGDLDSTAELVTQLAILFDRHGRFEETGLFKQLVQADEAVEEVERLLKDHLKFRTGFFDPNLASQPDRLRSLIQELLDHAELEETDLFPYAWQVLSGLSWDFIEGDLDRGTGREL